MKNFTRILASCALAILTIGVAQAQTPDTVCVNSTAVSYKVTPSPGSTYAWTLSGGGVLSSTTGDSISIDWGASAGNYELEVTETSIHGCVGDPVSLNIEVIELVTATLSGDATICYDDGTPDLTITLTGVGPYTFTYTDGTNNHTVNNHTSTTYIVPSDVTVPTAGTTPNTKTYTMVSVENKFCSGTTSGTATVVINPKPVTSAIIH